MLEVLGPPCAVALGEEDVSALRCAAQGPRSWGGAGFTVFLLLSLWRLDRAGPTHLSVVEYSGVGRLVRIWICNLESPGIGIGKEFEELQ